MARLLAGIVCLFLTFTLAAAPANADQIIRPGHNTGQEGLGDINLGGFTVLSGILGVGQGLRFGTDKIAASLDKNFKAQDSLLRQLLVGLGVSLEKTEHMRMFGPDSRAYNSFSKDYGSGIRAGLAAQSKLSTTLKQDLYGYLGEFDNRKRILDRLQAAPFGLESWDDIMEPGKLAECEETAKTIIEPFPALNLNKNLDSGRTAEHYRSARKAKRSRLLIPTDVMGELIASRAPVIEPGGWPGEVYRRMGDEGEGSDKTVDGKMSANSLYGTLTNMRFASQEWYSGKGGLHSMTDTGVLREILMAKIDSLMIEYQKMLWLDRMAALMAQKQLARNRGFDHALHHAKVKALQ